MGGLWSTSQYAEFRRHEAGSLSHRAALILNRISKGSCKTHGKRPRIRSKLVVGFRAGLRVFDGDFYNELSTTDILLGPGDLCSHVILVERHHFDVHAFCHSRSPLISGAIPLLYAQMLLV